MTTSESTLPVTVTCECGQTVEHKQWCRSVPKIIMPSTPESNEALPVTVTDTPGRYVYVRVDGGFVFSAYVTDTRHLEDLIHARDLRARLKACEEEAANCRTPHLEARVQELEGMRKADAIRAFAEREMAARDTAEGRDG